MSENTENINMRSCRLLLLLLLGNLSIIVTAEAETIAPPAHVKFDSVDYRNILQWTAASGKTSPPLQFNVQWKIYGEIDWLDVSGCQGILKHQCDLSNVTSDPREWYYARVHASSPPSNKSAWVLSPRFSPRWDTKLSPPVLRINVTEQRIVVRVKPPKPLVRKMHNSLVYKIYIIHTNGAEDVLEMPCCSNKLTLKSVNYQDGLCVQGQTFATTLGKSSDRSSKKCVPVM